MKGQTATGCDAMHDEKRASTFYQHYFSRIKEDLILPPALFKLSI